MASGMGETQILYGTSLPEEVTSGDTSCNILIPVHMQLEGVGLQPVVKHGNTITTATGVRFVRLSGIGSATATTIGDMILSLGSTVNLAFKFGTTEKAGQTAILGTYAFDIGEVIVKKLSSPVQLKAGERVRVRGAGATAMSATGDFIPFILVRVAGEQLNSVRVASDYKGIPANAT